MILSPQTLIEAHLASTPSLQHVSEAATVAHEIVEALQSAGWCFVAEEDLHRMAAHEVDLAELKRNAVAAAINADPVDRPVHRPGDPLFPSFMQALITYMGASTGP